jgi:heptosyltransferase-2
VRWFFEIPFRWMGYRKPVPPASFAAARSILIVRPDAKLGDVVLTSAFLRECRRNWPEAKVTLLADPTCWPLIEHCPYVDRVELYPRWRPHVFGQIRRLMHEANWARQHLWAHHFDLAIVPRWDHKVHREAFFAYFSGAKWRVGYSEEGSVLPRNEREYAEILYTHLVPSGPAEHEVQKMLELLTWMGGAVSETRIEVWIDEADRRFAATKLPDRGGAPMVRAMMMPGASVSSRRWPAERFGALAAWMTGELGWEVVLIGSNAEAELGRKVASFCSGGIVNLIGGATVRQTVAAMGRCSLYVGNDTGPMHMAAAMGVPVVEISCHPANGSPAHERSPLRFGPRDVPAWIARPAAGRDDCREFCVPGELGEPHCILAVTVEQVKDLVLQAAGREECGASRRE